MSENKETAERRERRVCGEGAQIVELKSSNTQNSPPTHTVHAERDTRCQKRVDRAEIVQHAKLTTNTRYTRSVTRGVKRESITFCCSVLCVRARGCGRSCYHLSHTYSLSSREARVEHRDYRVCPAALAATLRLTYFTEYCAAARTMARKSYVISRSDSADCEV